MLKPHAPDIRAFLLENPDGATVSQIQKALPRPTKDATVRKSLERMPDAYIDRWVNPQRGQWQAVWCIVDVPRHCPYPTERFQPETRWVGDNKCA